MKKLLLIPLLVLAPACAGMPLGLDGEPEGPSPEQIGSTAGAIVTTATGNPLLGGAVCTLVGAAVGWFARTKKKPAPAAP